MARVQIGHLPLDALSLDGAVATLADWAQSRQKRYVSLCTAYNFVLAHDDPQIFEAMSKANLIAADGMPLVWLQRRQGHRGAERIYGPDLMRQVCRFTEGTSVRHYFYGGMPGVAEKLAAQLKAESPGLQIAGAESPPRFATWQIEPDDDVSDMLNQTRSNIIWVGLGSPLQDLWMAAYRPYLDAPLVIGVGAAFDFVSGNKQQAPRWMQRSGLEWLFRLMTEPRRLGRRYLLYNPRFIWLIARWASGVKLQD